MWNCPSFRIAVSVVAGTASSGLTAAEHWLALSVVPLLAVVALVRFESARQGIGFRRNARFGQPLALAIDVFMMLLLVVSSAFYASARLESQTLNVCIMRERVVTLKGIVASFPEQTGSGFRLVMRTSDSDSSDPPLRDGTRVLVRIRGELSPASPGDTLIVTGVLRSARGPRNAGGFNEAEYLFLKGTSAVLTAPAFLKPTVRRVRPPRNLLALHVAPIPQLDQAGRHLRRARR